MGHRSGIFGGALVERRVARSRRVWWTPQYLQAFHLGLPHIPGESGDHVDEQPPLDVMCCCASGIKGPLGG
eukprot:6904857-Prymnesium_polylepis.1